MREPLAVIGREQEVTEILGALTERFSGTGVDVSSRPEEGSAVHEALVTHGLVIFHARPGTGATTLIEHLRHHCGEHLLVDQLSSEGLNTSARVQVISLIAPSAAHDTRALLHGSLPSGLGSSVSGELSSRRSEPGRINEDLTDEASAVLAKDLASAIAPHPTVILVDEIERYRPPLAALLTQVVERCSPHVACIITTHQPDLMSSMFASEPDTASIPLVALRALEPEDLWQITQSVIATQPDPPSDAHTEEALRANVSAPGVNAHLARLMGEAHLLGLRPEAHLLLNERVARLSPQAIALGTAIALWEMLLPITGGTTESSSSTPPRGALDTERFGSADRTHRAHQTHRALTVQMARAATGLPQRRVAKALRELHSALILDEHGGFCDRLWPDALIGIAEVHLLERYRIALADAVAKRTEGVVSDAVIIAELLCEVHTPPIRFSPWLKTAARALMTSRADSTQRYLRTLLRCADLSDPEIGVATAMLVQTRVALGLNDLRSQVSISMMEEFNAAPPAAGAAPGPSRYDAFALVMAGQLEAARAIYSQLSLQHQDPSKSGTSGPDPSEPGTRESGTNAPGSSQVAPDLLLEHAAVCALAGDLDICRNLATEVWARGTTPALRAGSGAMILLADTTAGRWEMACQLSHEVMAEIGDDRQASTARYQPWLFGALAQIQSNDAKTARMWLHEGRTHCAESGLSWAVPAHDALLSFLELRTGNLVQARDHARAAVDAGPEADGLGAANWAFATLLHLDYLNLVDPSATLAELGAWDAPVQVFGSDQVQRVRALIDLGHGRVESAYLRMERLWHVSCDRELWVVISEIALLTAHLGHLCGRSGMVADVISRLEDLGRRSGGSNVRVWCTLEILRGLREGNPVRAERAAELMGLEQFAITCAEAWSMVAQQWAHIAMTDRARIAATRSAEIYHRIGAQGWARQVMVQGLYE